MEMRLPDYLKSETLRAKIAPVIPPERESKDAKKTTKALDDLVKLIDELKAELQPVLDLLVEKFEPNNADEVQEKLADLKRKKVTAGWGEERVRKFGEVKDAAEVLRDLLDALKKQIADNAGKIGSQRAKDPSDAIRLLARLMVDGRSWVRDLGRNLSKFLADAEKAGERFAAADKGKDEEPDFVDKPRMISKMNTALKELRAAGLEQTFPFLMVDSREALFIYVARDARGGGMEQKVRDALGEDGKRATMIRGEVGFAEKRYLFVSEKLSGGTYPTRMQKQLMADLGRRLPIAVGRDKTALEYVDSDDFDDPLDFLIAERGPLLSRAKSCKKLREDVYRDLSKFAIMERGASPARMAQDLMDRADVAAEKRDLTSFEALMLKIKNEVISAHVKMEGRKADDEAAFKREEGPILRAVAEEQNALRVEKDRAAKLDDEAGARATEKRLAVFKELKAKLDRAVAEAPGKSLGGGFVYDGGWSKAKAILFELDALIVGNAEERKKEEEARQKREIEKKKRKDKDAAKAGQGDDEK